MNNPIFSPTPKVFIAGAGPGDKELITLKLYNVLQRAQVIITDRLVNHEIIDTYASPHAEVIYAGKEGNHTSPHSTAQTTINQLLVQKAREGKTVLRLKGGDVSFFSNLLDELDTLSIHQIDFEIIPGVTAASGAAAYAGIPLTARGFSKGVQFMTFHSHTAFTTDEWSYLARTKDTLVFYMSLRNVDILVSSLITAGQDPHTPIALIEQATTTFQRTHLSTLENSKEDFKDKKFKSPSLIIVGKVVELAKNFDWFKTSAYEGSTFKSLAI